MGRVLKTVVSRYWGMLLVFVFWQSWVTLGQLNAIVMPQPVDVLIDLALNPAVYLSNGLQTLVLAAMGLLLGMFGTALLMVWMAGRAFRAGALSDVKLSWKSFGRAVTGRS